MKTEIFDMHDHSQNSLDCSCPVEDTAKEAIKKGISAFVISDHCDIQFFTKYDMKNKIRNSIEETTKASEKYKDKIKILQGVELGEGIFNKNHMEEIVSMYDFDLIIGSVHEIRHKNYEKPYSGIDFSSFSETDVKEFLNVYFDDIWEMINTVPCNIMAHLTCPLRYITGKYKINVDLKEYEDKITKILEYIIKNDIALEINTSGINTPFNSLMPCVDIIKQFKSMGGYLITLGSDAHIYQNIANGFDETFELLKKYGFTKYYYFEKKKPHEVKLK